MNDRHIIQEAVFDIAFDSMQAAREQEAGLGAFIQDRLLPLADQVFGEIFPDGALARVDTLEIDLGDMDYGGFMEEMEARFHDRLRAALRDKLESLAASPSPNEGIVTKAQAERGRLEAFLETGRIEWNPGSGAAHEAEAMLQRAILEDGARLAAFLRKTPHREHAVKRLARQFPDPCLAQLAQLLVPGQEAPWEQWTGAIWKAWKNNLKGVTEKEFRSSVWELLIHEHLKSGSASGDRKKLFDEIIRRVFIQYATFQTGNSWEPQRNAERNTAPHSMDGREPVKPLDERKLLRTLLDAALAQGLAGNLNGKWEDIKTKHPDLLRASLKHWLGEESARAKVAEGFPEAMLLDIVRILAPAETSFMEALAAGIQNTTQGKANRKDPQLWEHTLKHLHTGERLDRSLYSQDLMQRLAGRPEEQAALLRAVRTADPILAAELAVQQRQAAQAGMEVKTLNAQEARKRIEAIITRNHGSLENGFWREIEAHAKSARDQQRYYQRVLESLLHDRIVDLEEAMGDEAMGEETKGAPQEASPVHGNPPAKQALDERKLLRTLLDAALAQGLAGELGGKWEDIKTKHPDLLRESLKHWLGEESARARIAEGFPEALLTDIVRILAPSEIHLITSLAGQSLTRTLGTAHRKNTPLWKLTLKHLHAGEKFDRRAYVQGLMQQPPGEGPGPTAILKIVGATDPQLAVELAAQQRQTGEMGTRETGTCETGTDVKTLNAQEARKRIEAIITRNHGNLENDFWREIEAHAKNARDQQRYYRRVLESLLHDRIVDLEEAMGESLEPTGNTARSLQTPAEKENPAQEGALDERELLRTHLDSALAQGLAGDINGKWEDIKTKHPDLIRESFKRWMGEESARAKVAAGFPEAMLLDMVRLLAPREINFIKSVGGQMRAVAQGTAHGGNAQLWEHTLKYLQAGERFDRRAYARSLMLQLSAHGQQQAALLRAVGEADPQLAAELAAQQRQAAEEEAAGAPQNLLRREHAHERPAGNSPLDERKLLRTLLDAALAQGLAGELGGKWEEIKTRYPDLIRESFKHLAGEESARARIAEGFPEALLTDIVRILAPSEIHLITSLAGQALTQTPGTAHRKNTPLWKLTLRHLHAGEKFDRRAYVQGLMQQPPGEGPGPTAILKIAGATDPRLAMELDMELSAQQRQTGKTGTGETGTGATGTNVKTLNAQEARKRIEAIITRNHGSLENDFWREIEAHAKNARDQQRYYQRVLESLLHDRIVDLEEAMGEETKGAPQEASPVHGNPPAKQALDERKLLRTLLDAALAQGLAGELGGKWDDIKTTHPDLLRASLKHWLGEESARAKVAEGFPEAMLLDIVRILAPAETSFMEALAAGIQKAMHGRVNGKNTHFWKHTLKHLHTGSLDRRDYLLTLIHELAGQEDAVTVALETLSGSHPQLAMELAAQQRQTGDTGTGETGTNVKTLNAQEARKRVEAIITRNHGSLENGFWREIEAHAKSARDQQRYYQRVLESLLHDRIVDLEEAMGEETKGAPQEAVRRTEALEGADPKIPLDERKLLRTLLDAALAQGLAGELGGKWEDIKTKHPDLLRESLKHWLGEESARARIAEGFPEALLTDIVRILAPSEIHLITSLAGQSLTRTLGTAHRKNTPLWKLTLKHLHAGEKFDRRAYVQGLMQQPPGEGPGPTAILKIVGATDPQLAVELAAQQRQTGEMGTRETGTRETGTDVKTLNAQEARKRIEAIITRNHGNLENEFWREIEAHAKNARDQQRYYQRVLESLLHNRIVDLEEAMGEEAMRAPRGNPPRVESLPEAAAREPSEPAAAQLRKSMPEKAGQASAEAEPGNRKFHHEEGAAHSAGREAAPLQPMHAPARPGLVPEKGTRPKEMESAEEIYIANAGLVLLAPYMPQLFKMLDLTDGQQFRSEKAADRAIHLLQFAVNESSGSAEFLLALNKIVCGVAVNMPISREIEILDHERETIEGMLKAIIQSWTIIGKTTVEGLRESFLQRGGRLQWQDDGWQLKVEQKGMDVLLDQLPWSFAIIKHPWMTQPIYVEWR